VTRRRASALAVAVSLALAGCSTGSDNEAEAATTSSTRSTEQGNVRLTDLTSVEQLRTRFNDDRGSARLLLLLSPT
jgi:outer membrane lipoprotein SlyB